MAYWLLLDATICVVPVPITETIIITCIDEPAAVSPEQVLLWSETIMYKKDNKGDGHLVLLTCRVIGF